MAVTTECSHLHDGYQTKCFIVISITLKVLVSVLVSKFLFNKPQCTVLCGRLQIMSV